MNPSYISTAFHRETGMTIKEYILWQKTEEGKRLLSATRDSISKVSTELHFPSSVSPPGLAPSIGVQLHQLPAFRIQQVHR